MPIALSLHNHNDTMNRPKTVFSLIFLILTVTNAFAATAGKATPTNLTCNLRSGLVVTDDEIRLGWQLSEPQTAYSLIIEDATTGREVLHKTDVRSISSQLISITLPDGYYRWRVQTRNSKGRKSAWSEPAEFIRQSAETAFGEAQWVGAITKADANTPEGRTFTGAELKARVAEWDAASPLSRRSIYVSTDAHLAPGKTIKNAILNVCGLGFYELRLNNVKVGDSEFAPTWSDYDKSVFYNTYVMTPADIAECLRTSDGNEIKELNISALLGNGFYNEQGGRYHKLRISFGPPTLKLHLAVNYADGTSQQIVTDGTWKWSPSEITLNSIYGGEDYDARITRQWNAVVRQEGPKGMLRPQLAPPVKIMHRYTPQTIHYLSSADREGARNIAKRDITPGAFVLDMGQNMSGIPEIKVCGRAGQTVTIFVSETITPEGACNQRQTGRQHYYTYTLKGDGEETWRPRFAYYGFRYMQVEGAKLSAELQQRIASDGTIQEAADGETPVITDINACFVHNSAATVSTFECSNTLVNKTHELIDKATRSNMQSVFTDCPHREKLGWLEQDWLNGPGLFMNYDLTGFAAQTMQNIADAQHPDGGIPTTAPEYVYFRGPGMDAFAESPEWGGTFIMMPWMYYKYYGDDALMRRYYDQMLNYVNYLSSKAEDNILDQGLGDWYDYGDFRAGFSHNTSVPLVATAHYYRWTDLMRQIAGILGKSSDETLLEQRCERIRQAWLDAYWNIEGNDTIDAATRNLYRSQTALAIALDLHLLPDADRQKALTMLKDDIMAHGCRLTTGDIGNRYLYEVLCEENEYELLYRMLNHDDVPGYGFQIKKGMTTLTEQWNPDMGSSMNHFMMGQIDGFLFTSLMGINIDGKSITFRPQVAEDITFVRGSTVTPYGRVAVSMHRDNGLLTAEFTVPFGMTATLVNTDGSHHLFTAGTQKVVIR